MHFELVGAVAVSESAQFAVHLAEFVRVDAASTRPSHGGQHIVQGIDLAIDFGDLGKQAVNFLLLFSQRFDEPEFQLLRVLPFLKAIDFDEKLLDPDIVIPLIVFNLLPGLKFLGLLRQLLD